MRQRDQHQWLTDHLTTLDDATRDRVERLWPIVRRRVLRRFCRDHPDVQEERASYATLRLIMSLQQAPQRPDRLHLTAAAGSAGDYLYDEARAWGVNRYQYDGRRRHNWHPVSLDHPDVALKGRRIEDVGGLAEDGDADEEAH